MDYDVYNYSSLRRIKAYAIDTYRFVIMEEIGCFFTYGDDVSNLLVLDTPPTILPLISLVFYSRTYLFTPELERDHHSPFIAKLIYTYIGAKKDLEQISTTSGAAFNRRGFTKVLALGLFDTLITFPLGILNIVIRAQQIHTSDALSTKHATTREILTITSREWRSAGFGVVYSVRIDQWADPFFAVIFFCLFGLTEQKRAWYRDLFWSAMRRFGVTPRPDDPHTSVIVFVPHYVDTSKSATTDSVV